MEDFSCVSFYSMEVIKVFEFLTSEYPELKRAVARIDFSNALPAFQNKQDLFIIQELFKMLMEACSNDEWGKIPFSDLFEVFEIILEVYYKPNQNVCIYMIEDMFTWLFEELIEDERFTANYCEHFFLKCSIAGDERIEEFLHMLYPDELKIVLDCFVERRFSDPHHMKESDFLMDHLQNERPVCETLVMYGFAYFYEHFYYRNLCSNFVDGMTWIRFGEDHFCRYVDKEMLVEMGGLRLQMAMELLVALFVRPQNRTVVSLIWRSQPYPFITAEELHNLLQPFVVHRLDLLKKACEEFKNVNMICPVPEVSQPRSLKHLSRVQIRKCLNEANTLNDKTIERLDIPVTLKRHLNLDDFN